MGRLMRDQVAAHLARNPFSTKFIRPGAIDFVVELGDALPDIFARFERFGLSGQVVGPHGSGKSTLLWALRPLLEQRAEVHWTQVPPRVDRGWQSIRDLVGSSLEWPRPKYSCQISSIGVSRPESSMGLVGSNVIAATPIAKPLDVPPQHGKPVVWVIDGFDSLSWIVRRAIRGFSLRERIGLLITTHRDLKLPTLSRPFLSSAAFRNLVQRLLADYSVDLDEHDIQQAYDRHVPNVREALFELYDAYERRRLPAT